MKLEHLATQLDLAFQGDAQAEISHLADINTATAGSLAFVASARYENALKTCKASAVIVPENLIQSAPSTYLVSTDPYLSYARASQLLHPENVAVARISGSAAVSEDATVDASADIGERVVIAAGATVGADCVIGAGSYIGSGVIIGPGTRIHPNVTIEQGCRIGRDCRIQAGAVIGSDGFGYAWQGSGDEPAWVKINQIGAVVIGDQVEIGANTTIDRGALGDTIIGKGVILDNQIQIAHNVRIGEFTAIAGCVGIAGSTVIGKCCRIGGKTAIVGHIKIADNVVLTATSFVSRSITEAGIYSSGMPLQKNAQWRKTFARIAKLDDLFLSFKRFRRSLPVEDGAGIGAIELEKVGAKRGGKGRES